MKITLQIPAVLRSCCDGKSQLAISARTVNAVLQQLENSYPSLYRSVCDETGSVRRHINLFVNLSLVHGPEDFDTELAQGDVVSIFQAVSGG